VCVCVQRQVRICVIAVVPFHVAGRACVCDRPTHDKYTRSLLYRVCVFEMFILLMFFLEIMKEHFNESPFRDLFLGIS